MPLKPKNNTDPARIMREVRSEVRGEVMGEGPGSMLGMRSFGLRLRDDNAGGGPGADPDDLIPRREKGEHDFHAVRSFIALREDGTPASFDREARALEVVATTESPVLVYDWEMGYVPEVLLMSGCKLPKARQVPFQDAHNRWSVSDTLGSARDLRTEGDRLLARVHFSSTPEGESCMTKYGEGDLTDVSVGWRELKCTKLKEGEKRTVAGREWQGPMRLVTSWQIKELSAVPIGADERAKARAEEKNTEAKMDPKIYALLVQLGLKADATEDEARAHLVSLGLKADATLDDVQTFLRQAVEGRARGGAGGTAAAQGGARGDNPAGADPAHQAGAAAQDPDGVRAAGEAGKKAAHEYMQQEIKRISDIRGMCAQYGCPELTESMIQENKTVDQARAAILDHLTGSRQTDGLHAPTGSLVMGADARDKYREAVVYSLIKRSSVQIKDLKDAAGWEDFRSYSLREVARHCLMTAGQSTRGDIMEVVGRALTTSDLPAILADVANKSLVAGFDDQPETYESWTGEVSASDFKAMNLVSVTTLEGLLAVSEHGEFKYGYFRDKLEQLTLGTAGRIYPVTRQAIINDDLNAITVVFAGAGAKARQYTGDLVYALLVSNPTMNEDSTALFHDDHGNIGTQGAVDVDTLNEMDALFAAQTDGNGGRPNIPMQYLIAPRGKRGGIETFFATKEYIDANGLTVENIWKTGIERVYEPRLTGNGWYVAGPKGRTIVRAYLGGNKTPYTEQRSGWTVDGVELKVRHDVGVGVTEWRAMAYNAGR